MSQIFYPKNKNKFSYSLSSSGKKLLVFDRNTAENCSKVLFKRFPELSALPQCVINAGEQHKNLASAQLIWSSLLEHKLSRQGELIGIGGGVVTDLVGFAASTYKRGLSFSFIPTTLLAMVDACYGGKTGMNFEESKNQIGTFCEAKDIYIDSIFLETLSERQKRNGAVEMIKHLILNDNDSSAKLNSIKELSYFYSDEEIQKSLLLKKKYVDQDFKDEGIRQALNFGHSIGHAIESVGIQQSLDILHGEAVLLGMIIEAKISEELLNCPSDIRSSLESIRTKHFKDVHFQLDISTLLPFLLQDKKNEGAIHMSLLNEHKEVKIKTAVPINLLDTIFT